jgi:hypothetical protein
VGAQRKANPLAVSGNSETNVRIAPCTLAKSGGRQDRVTALAATGRATPYIAAHVPGEIDEHLAKMAVDFQVSERQARRVLEVVPLN